MVPSFPKPLLKAWWLLALSLSLGSLRGSAATVLVDGGKFAVPASRTGSRALPSSRDVAAPIPRAIICEPAPADWVSQKAIHVALQASAPLGAKEPIAVTTTGDPSGELPLWRIRFSYFQCTDNSLGELFSGQVSTIAQNGLGLTANRMLIEDLWNTPINVLVQGGLMWHNEKGTQSNGWQVHFGINVEWDRWPWDHHLRTRLGLACGSSYANQIPYAEILHRDGESSKHLLHYLEPSLSLNCGDLARLTRIHRLCATWDSHRLDNVWIVGSIPHRSGMWGVYGDDSGGNSLTGGSNYLSIGIETEF